MPSWQPALLACRVESQQCCHLWQWSRGACNCQVWHALAAWAKVASQQPPTQTGPFLGAWAFRPAGQFHSRRVAVIQIEMCASPSPFGCGSQRQERKRPRRARRARPALGLDTSILWCQLVGAASLAQPGTMPSAPSRFHSTHFYAGFLRRSHSIQVPHMQSPLTAKSCTWDMVPL